MGRGNVFSLLWTPSRRRGLIGVGWRHRGGRAANRGGAGVEPGGCWQGGGEGREDRAPSEHGAAEGSVAPVFYGLLQDDGEDCRLAGHFQLHPVGRLYIAAWIVMSTLLALSLLVAGALRATADSTAQDALPFMLPTLLPFVGLGLARWQRRRGQADEAAMRDWLKALQ